MFTTTANQLVSSSTLCYLGVAAAVVVVAVVVVIVGYSCSPKHTAFESLPAICAHVTELEQLKVNAVNLAFCVPWETHCFDDFGTNAFHSRPSSKRPHRLG